MWNSGDSSSPVWYDDCKRALAGDKMKFVLADLKTVLMPRQVLPKKLHPLGNLLVPEVST
jgi:hypothetical protein